MYRLLYQHLVHHSFLSSCSYGPLIAFPVILGLIALNFTALAMFSCKYMWVEEFDEDGQMGSDYYVGVYTVEYSDYCEEYDERHWEVDWSIALARGVGTAVFVVTFFVWVFVCTMGCVQYPRKVVLLLAASFIVGGMLTFLLPLVMLTKNCGVLDDPPYQYIHERMCEFDSGFIFGITGGIVLILAGVSVLFLKERPVIEGPARQDRVKPNTPYYIPSTSTAMGTMVHEDQVHHADGTITTTTRTLNPDGSITEQITTTTMTPAK